MSLAPSQVERTPQNTNEKEIAEEESTTLFDIAVAEGFTLFTIRMLELTLHDALGISEDCSHYLCGDISDDAQKELHEMMLSSYELILQQIRFKGTEICQVLGPDRSVILDFFNQATSIEDVMKYDWNTPGRINRFIDLSVKMYEDNLYSLDPDDRMLLFTLRLVQTIRPDSGPFNSQEMKDWVSAHPSKLIDIELNAFKAIISELITEYMQDIQDAFKDIIKETLIMQFVTRIICGQPLD